MTGEEKRTRSKRCLSRSKRSKPEKFSDDNACSQSTGQVFTAVRPRQTDNLRQPGGVDQLGNEVAELTEEISVNSSKLKVCGEKLRNHKHDAFEFCDSDGDAVNDDDTTGVIGSDTYTNKRKRINSEEIEGSGFTRAISRFKRAHKAISNLNQPFVQLEKCAYNRRSKFESQKTDECNKRNKLEDHTKGLQNKMKSLRQVVKDAHEELELETEKGDKVSNIHEGESQDNTDLRGQHDLELLDDKTDSTRNQTCPICGMTFLPTENMDAINQHINGCLDKDSGNRITEDGLSEPTGESIREDLFFCQLCQKDLSKMNSQRRQQHINRCCDQASKAKEIPHVNEVGGQTSNLLQCPICGKRFKSSKVN